jgi:hypothetical protein
MTNRTQKIDIIPSLGNNYVIRAPFALESVGFHWQRLNRVRLMRYPEGLLILPAIRNFLIFKVK